MNLRSESGLILPITALLVGIMLVFLVVLGVESAMVKWAALELKAKTETMCSFVAESSLLQREAVYRFRQELSDLSIWHTTIDKAVLVIPTMPEKFGFPSSSEDADYDCDDCRPEINGRASPIALLGYAPCRAGTQDFCSFIGDANPNHSEVTQWFPDTLLNNRSDAGVTSGCILEGSVKLVLSEPHPIRAVSSWWRPLRFGLAEENDETSVLPTQYRGLTVAVSTHLTTDAKDPRFRFSGIESNHDIYSADFRKRYDPLWMETPWLFPQGRSAFGTSTPPRAFNSALELPSLPPLSAQFRSAQAPLAGRQARTDIGHDRETSYDDRTDLVLSDREEMYVACANPVTLLRNTFVATILELAARHAQLRNATEVLHIGSANRILENPLDKNSLPLIPNSPTLITGFGQDLVQQQYQLPYVFFHSGNITQTPSEFLPHKGGWLNPLSVAGTLTPSMRSHQAMVASQLRSCYHMYYGSEASPPGLERYGISGERPFTNTLIDNTGFEPAFGRDNGPWQSNQAFYKSAQARPQLYPGENSAWDQDCAWNSTGCDLQTSRPLRATEVVAALGTTQNCPYYEGGIDGQTCYKPAPENDLRPDLLGLLHYVTRSAVNTSLGNIALFPAVNSPGLFPLAADARPLPLERPDTSAYSTAQNISTALLVVLHRPLSGPQEMEAIRRMTTSENMRGRPIRLVYFPARQADYSEAAISDLKYAFNITSDEDDLIAKGNYPRVFSPYLQDDSGEFIYPQFTDQSDSLNHRNYWYYLLNDDRNNMVSQAKDYFYTVLLRLELKF